jgi:hypothetical protein
VVDAAGDVITYEIVVTNDGNVTLTGVVVSDPLLEGANGTLGAAVETGGTGVNGDGILDVGETWTYTGTYEAQQSDIDNDGGGDGDIDNTATVSSDELDDETSSASVPIEQQEDCDVANIILVLDSSSSMDAVIDGTTRMEALKDSVNDLLDYLTTLDAEAIKVQIIDFDNSAASLGAFEIVSGHATDATALQNAKNAVDLLDPDTFAATGGSGTGFTNYEAGLQAGLDYIGSGNPLAGADVNQLIFISDGAPNFALTGDSTDLGDVTGFLFPASTALAHVTGTGSGDTNSELLDIATAGYTLDAVGVDVGAPALANLDVLDADGTATNVTSPAELTGVLLDISCANETIQELAQLENPQVPQ